MVVSGSPGGDCGCASRERAGVAGLATSALPLSGPASTRDGETAGPRARDPHPHSFCLIVVGLGEIGLLQRRSPKPRDAGGLGAR